MPLDRTAYYADASTPASLAAITAAMADAEADQVEARSSHTFRPANAAGLTALSGLFTLRTDDRAYQIDTGVTYRWNGSAWKAWESDWITYTSTLTNVTIGTGTQLFRYQYVDGTIELEALISFASGSTMGTAPTFSLPVAMASDYRTDHPLGVGQASPGGTNHPISVWRNGSSTTTVAPYALLASGTYVTPSNITSTVPASWTTSSTLALSLRYRPA